MSRNITTTPGAAETDSLAAHHAPSMAGITTLQPTIPLESLPPISMDRFVEQSGLSSVTLWRFRKKGWLRTHQICGRHYLSAAEIARFNARLESGEFAGDGPRTPKRVG